MKGTRASRRLNLPTLLIQKNALEEEQRLYEDLVRTQPAGIYRLRIAPVKASSGHEWERIVQSHYHVEFVSDRFCEISGLARSAFQADPASILDRIHPEDRKGFSDRNADAMMRRVPFRWEGQLVKDGRWCWVRFESSPRSLADGGTLWTGVLTDITEERRAAEVLHRNHAVLTGIMESAEGPIFSVDQAYRYTSFNQSHAAVMKALYDTDIALGTSLLDHQTVPADREMAKLNLDRALAGEAFTEEAMSGEKGRSRLYFEVAHTPIRESGGEVIGIAVFARDITKRRVAEEALKALEARAQTMVQTTHDGVWLLRMDGQIEDVNLAACRMLGYSPGELMGMQVGDLEAMETGEEVRRHSDRILEQGMDLFESLHRRKDGTVFPVEVSITAIPESGQMVAFIRDITLRKKNQESLRRATDLLCQVESIAGVGGWEIDLREQSLFWKGQTYCIHDLEADTYSPSVESAIQFYAPEWRPVITLAIQESIETGHGFDLELEMITAKGRRIWVRTSGRPILMGGRAVKVLGAFRDITEEKEAEDALRVSESHNRALVAAIPDLIFTSRRDGVFLAVHAPDPNVLFVAPEVFLHRKVEEILPRPIAVQFMKAYSDALDSHRVQELYYTLPLGGEERHFEARVARCTEDTVVTLVRDITERKQAEEKLRETNAYLENLINHANAPIIVWDSEFRITRFNHAFEFLTGRSEAEVLGQSLELLFPPSLVAHSMSEIRKMQTGEHWETVEIKILHRDESVRTVLWNSATLIAKDGRTPMATIAQGQDITEQRRGEELIKGQLDELHRWQDVMLDREDRVQQLKREVNDLAQRLGEDIRYSSQVADPAGSKEPIS